MTLPTLLGDVAWIDARIVDPTLPLHRGLPHISAENIVPITGELIEVRSATEDGMESGKYLFDRDVVLYSKLRPYLRKAAVADFPGLCSADMYPLKTDLSRLLPDYLRALLVSAKFTAYANVESARSRMPKLNREQLFSYEVRLPPVAEQLNALAHLKLKLTEVETAQQAAKHQDQEAKALRGAIYSQAFRRIVPVVGAQDFDAAPPRWRWHKLTDIARLESGHTPSRVRPDWWGGDISWISLTEIRAFDGQWVESTQLRTNEAGLANSAARLLPRGTVCYSRTASVGFVAIMGRPMATSQDFANWVCGDALDPEFLMHALIRSRAELRELASGATHKTIYMPTLKTFHVCAPAIDEQRQIVEALKKQLAEADTIRCAAMRRDREISALPQRFLAQVFEN